MLPLRLPPPGPDFAPKLQSQTLRAPEAGLSRTPLKPPCHGGAPRLPRPEVAALRSSLLQQDLSKGHFLPRTLLPSPTLPRAQLQKQLVASTLPTWPPRPARPHLSAALLSGSPRLWREAPTTKRGVPPAHPTPRAPAARPHPTPRHLVLYSGLPPAQKPAYGEGSSRERRNKSLPLPSCILHHVSAVCHVKSGYSGSKTHTHIRGVCL